MKKLILAMFILFAVSKINAQWDVSASMGLDFKSAPSFRDYVNYVLASNQVSSFKSAVAFGAEVDYLLKNNFAIGIDYNLQIDSYNIPSNTGAGGNSEISYLHHRPTILAYYVIPGNGYQFKFGGGVGFRSVSLTQKLMSDETYSATGIGFVGRAMGNTKLSDNLYALIGADLRYDLPGDFSNSGNKIVNPATGSNVNLNSFSIGIYLGLTYKL